MTADRSNLQDLIEVEEGGTVVGLLLERDGSVTITTADGRDGRFEGEDAQRFLSLLSGSVAGGLAPGVVYVRKPGPVFGFEAAGEVSS